MYFGFQNVSVAYGKKQILNNVSMEFEQNQITSIIGPNGCGKSTLLKTIPGTVVPKSGTVIFQDRNIKSYAPKELAKKIAYLPQLHTSPSDIDVRTLVSYGRYPYKKFGCGLTSEDQDIIEQTLEMTGLQNMGERMLDNLSGGEKQRAWIAMTICQRPEVLLLDEPTTYLDVGYQVEVLETIRELRERLNITIVMVLHDMNFTARYSDRIYVLKDQKVYDYGEPSRIISTQPLREVFSIDSRVYTDEVNACPFIIPEKIPAQDARF